MITNDLFAVFKKCSSASLAARLIWRLDKEGSVVSDMQLTTVEELEDHIADLQEDELKELKVDIHNFLDYWPRNSKQHTIDDISHVFGVVRLDAFSPEYDLAAVCFNSI